MLRVCHSAVLAQSAYAVLEMPCYCYIVYGHSSQWVRTTGWLTREAANNWILHVGVFWAEFNEWEVRKSITLRRVF